MSMSSHGFSLGLREEKKVHYFSLKEIFKIQAMFQKAWDEDWSEERIVKNFLAEIKDPGETITPKYIVEMFNDFKKWNFRLSLY